MARYVIMSLVLAVAAFGQAQQSVALPHDKEVPESVEHKYARQKLEQAYKRAADMFAQFKELQAEVTDLMNKGAEIPTALMDQVHAVGRAYDQIDKEFPALKSRLQHADDCVGVYKKTIDEKVSDTTNRESEQIKACKALDLYPPEK